MKLIDSIFKTVSRIIIQLIIASLAIWLLNGGVNDWGVLHRIAMSISLLGGILFMLLLTFVILCIIYYLAKWMYDCIKSH